MELIFYQFKFVIPSIDVSSKLGCVKTLVLRSIQFCIYTNICIMDDSLGDDYTIDDKDSKVVTKFQQACM